MQQRDRRDNAYDDDVFGWSREQANLLREGRFDDLDLENVAEEIESVGRSQASALQSSYRLIALHLLKALFQPERMSRSSVLNVLRERLNAEDCLNDNPSLKPRRDALFAHAYVQARKLASAETGLPLNTFPIAPPFTLDELAREDYAPWTAPDV